MSLGHRAPEPRPTSVLSKLDIADRTEAISPARRAGLGRAT
jgi:DNA-binding NarL/FixJ family response regulator